MPLLDYLFTSKQSRINDSLLSEAVTPSQHTVWRPLGHSHDSISPVSRQ